MLKTNQLRCLIDDVEDTFVKATRFALCKVLGVDSVISKANEVLDIIPLTKVDKAEILGKLTTDESLYSIPLASVAGASDIVFTKATVDALNEVYAGSPLKGVTWVKCYIGLILGLVLLNPKVLCYKKSYPTKGEVWSVTWCEKLADTSSPHGVKLPCMGNANPQISSKVLGSRFHKLPNLHDGDKPWKAWRSLWFYQNQPLRVNQRTLEIMPYTQPDLGEYKYAHAQAKARGVEVGIDKLPISAVKVVQSFKDWYEQSVHQHNCYHGHYTEILTKLTHNIYNEYLFDSRGRMYTQGVTDYIGDKVVRGYIEFAQSPKYHTTEQDINNLEVLFGKADDVEILKCQEVLKAQINEEEQELRNHEKALTKNTEWFAKFNLIED